MADFIDKMKMGLNKGVATISTGSKTMVEKTKVNSIVNNLESEKRRIYEAMGYRVWEFSKTNPETDFPAIDMVSFCNEIEQRNTQIEEQKKKLAELESEMNKVLGTQPSSGQVICDCGYANIAGSKFCAKCGNKLAEF